MKFIEGSPISFPGLKIGEFNPPMGIEFSDNFSIQFYGIIIAVGLLLAVYYGLKRSRQFGLREDDILDGVLWIVPLSIICARLYYCIFEWDAYKDDPISLLYIWKGGLAIYGAVIGAAAGVIIHCLVKKVRLPALLDLVALCFLIGQSLGRWGNFFNREAFGEPTEFFLRMGLGDGSFYHPTFLYESLWNAAGFVALHFLSKKRQYDGQIALGYVAWYGLGRTFIEGLRMDSLYWGDFRVSQVLAAATCFVAVAILLFMAFRKHDRAKLYCNVMAETLAAEAAAKAEKKTCKCKQVQQEETPVEETPVEEAPAEEAPAEEAPAEEPTNE